MAYNFILNWTVHKKYQKLFEKKQNISVENWIKNMNQIRINVWIFEQIFIPKNLQCKVQILEY